MPEMSFAGRQLGFSSPLGHDALSLVGFEGYEVVSEPFSFRLELRGAKDQAIDFASLLAQDVRVALTADGAPSRYFHGIVSKFREVEQDDSFTHYVAEMTPKFWLLKKRRRSRIFQGKTVLQILAEVLAGLDVDFRTHEKFYPHNYCVQYRESDFDFASRLMEEEGLHYYFTHSADEHVMVVTDASHPSPELEFDMTIAFDRQAGGVVRAARVRHWQVSREVPAAEFLLWDHSFEMTGDKLQASEPLRESIDVGTRSHRLTARTPLTLETFDYPGNYAHRFDAIGADGNEESVGLSQVFEQNRRSVRIAAEREAVASLVIEGVGDSVHFTAGHAFTLAGHPHGDGAYLLTRVEHSVRNDGLRSAATDSVPYRNRFTCIPSDLPFRPPVVTPRPTVQGAQTATVVGVDGEEIFTDKYGRVKVQFHWDREGRFDASSSCWLRIAQSWAGKNWGSHYLPRAGHEVLVGFLEGDPDQPIVFGSLYNNDQMPPFDLPGEGTSTGTRSRSNSGDSSNYSEMTIDDTLGSEKLKFHAEKDMTVSVESDHSHSIGGNHSLSVGADSTTRVAGNHSIYVGFGSDGSGSGSGGSSDGREESSDSDSSDSSSGSESAWNKFFVNGHTAAWYYGDKEEITVGFKNETALISNAEVTAGVKLEFVGGVFIEVVAGLDVSIMWTADIDITLASKTLFTVGAKDLISAAALDITSGAAMAIDSGAALIIASAGVMSLDCAGDMSVVSTFLSVASTNIAVAGTLAFAGDITIVGAVSVTGDVTIEGMLAVVGEVAVVGDVAILGAVTIDGLTPVCA